ncbi:MAG: bifunctional alpha/beta hydrolase/class I SAM-dependent methyltransferase [Polyangiaceae bacterium]
MGNEKRIVAERTFASSDGTELFYRHWRGKGERAIVLFHRGHEHSGRLQDVVDSLGLPEYDCFAWDARGLGRSPGVRGFAEHFGVFLKDADCFVRHISARHNIAATDMAVVAQSVGAVIAAAWVHDYAPDIRCLVLASPALKVKLYVPFARQLIALKQRFKPGGFVNSYVKAKYLTHDEARIASYNSDPLITRPIAENILVELYEVAERLVEDATAITTPTQLLVSGSDWVVHQEPMKQLFRNLGSASKEYHEFPGFFHDTLGEKDRHLPLARAREFIERHFAAPFVPSDLARADKQGFTYVESEMLMASLEPLSLKWIFYGLTRLNIRLCSHISTGLKLGIDTGFDSGSTLDYVYENRPRGKGPIGRFVDKTYLESIGWRGIRIRKQHIELLIAKAAALLREKGLQVRIMDIAAGHGRYILDAAANVKADSVLLRDYSDLNVTAGRALIAGRGLGNIAQFISGDAFDTGSLAAVTPNPTLAVVSGLYELFADNALIRASLSGISQAVRTGGFLVYTNQPWHPQLELIARTLTSHRQHQSWVMRRRTQREMDQLVAEAGFEKVDQYSDRWGIFSVSLARRR